MKRKGIVPILVIVFAIAFWVILTQKSEVPEIGQNQIVEKVYDLPECPTEDSEDCFWNAKTQGNGKGKSFVRWQGKTYYQK